MTGGKDHRSDWVARWLDEPRAGNWRNRTNYFPAGKLSPSSSWLARSLIVTLTELSWLRWRTVYMAVCFCHKMKCRTGQSEVLWTTHSRIYFLHMLAVKMLPGIFIFYFINVYPRSNNLMFFWPCIILLTF